MEHNVKGFMRLLISLVLIALVIYLGASAKSAFENDDAIDQNVITVTADSREFAKPDIAVASFTVTKENASVETARGEVDSISNKVVAYLKQAGIEEKDIRTTSYNMYPREIDNTPPCYGNPCPPRRTSRTFVVEATYEVRIRTIEKAGEIISGVSAEGVNQIGALRFEVDEPRMKELALKAREAAIAKAREDAEKLAEDLDVKLGKLRNFSESGGGRPIPYYYGKAVSQDSAGAAPAPSIASGQNEIVSTVTLIYEIR